MYMIPDERTMNGREAFILHSSKLWPFICSVPAGISVTSPFAWRFDAELREPRRNVIPPSGLSLHDARTGLIILGAVFELTWRGGRTSLRDGWIWAGYGLQNSEGLHSAAKGGGDENSRG
jgi:hypothetical protein